MHSKAQDATFKWAKRMGSNSVDAAHSMAIDAAGNVYTVGGFVGTVDFDPSPTKEYLLKSLGDADVFISKLDASGNFVWVKRLGGKRDDFGNGIALDAKGNIYTTGCFQDTADFNPSPTETFNLIAEKGISKYDAFISKLDAQGNFKWAKSIGGPSSHSENGSSIAVDDSANVYTTGNFGGTVDFDPSPTKSYTIKYAGGSEDAYISKLNTDGDFVWALSFGSFGNDQGVKITVGPKGSIYTTGSFSETVDFDPSPQKEVKLKAKGKSDEFVIKLGPAGNLVWAKQLGDTSGEYIGSILDDGHGSIYLTGSFGGKVDFDPDTTKTYFMTTASTQWADAFVAKWSDSGSLVWVKQIGGSKNEIGASIATDKYGYIYTVGTFSGPADFDPDPVKTYELTTNNSQTIYISKLDASGNFVWAKQLGYMYSYRRLAFVVDSFANIYTAGEFQAIGDFDPSPLKTFEMQSAGYSDIFVHKMVSCLSTNATISPLACNSYISPSRKYEWTVSGTYQDIIANKAGCDSIIKINLTVVSVDTSITVNGSTLSSNANKAQKYQWLDCENNFMAIAGETGRSFTAKKMGKYAVEVTENNCASMSRCVDMNTVGLDEKIVDPIIIYPNPNNGSFLVRTNTPIDISVINSLGQIVYCNSCKTGSQTITLGDQLSGVYIVHLQDENSHRTYRLVINR